MEIKQALAKGTEFLKNKGIDSARVDTEILLSHVLKIPRIELYLKFDQPLSELEITRSRELLVKRSTGYPVAYITESRGFYKSDFEVLPGVLIPRPETEHLVEKSIEISGASGLVYDWGCGTGCIGLSFLLEKPDWQLQAFDLSEIAVENTRRNIDLLNLGARAQVCHLDIEKTEFEHKPNLILANPPYIDVDSKELQASVKQFEPSEALISDQKGLGHELRWAELAASLLDSGSYYCAEIGFDQKAKLAEPMSRFFSQVEFFDDYSGHPRVMLCKK